MLGLIIGPVLSFVLSFLKHVPVIGPAITNHPKVIATILSAVVSVLTTLHLGSGNLTDILTQLSQQIGTIAQTTAVAASAAVATHEAINNTALDPSPAKPPAPPNPLIGR